MMRLNSLLCLLLTLPAALADFTSTKRAISDIVNGRFFQPSRGLTRGSLRRLDGEEDDAEDDYDDAVVDDGKPDVVLPGDDNGVKVNLPFIVFEFSSDEVDLSKADYHEIVTDLIGQVLDDGYESLTNVILDEIQPDFTLNVGLPGSKAAVFVEGRAFFDEESPVPSEMELAQFIAYIMDDDLTKEFFERSGDDFLNLRNMHVVINDSGYEPDLDPNVAGVGAAGQKDSSGGGKTAAIVFGVFSLLCLSAVAVAGLVLWKKRQTVEEWDESNILQPSRAGVSG